MRTFKILFIAQALDKPEMFLVSGLKNKGMEVLVVVGDENNKKIIHDDFKLPVVHHKISARFSLRSILYLRNVIKNFRPDIVHSLSGRAVSNSLFASIGLGVKHVAYRGTMGNLSYWDPASRFSFLSNRLDAIICVSDAVRNDLISIGVPATKAIRIYKGHDPKWYRDIPSATRAEYGLPETSKLIACVANSRPVKGLDILIEAFKKLPKELHAKLVLIGEIREKSIKDAIADEENIKSLGFMTNPARILRVCDLFCMPSRRREGFPKALLEAMLVGLPAIVTAVGGMPEIVLNGKSGIVVPPEDPQAMSDAIKSILTDPDLFKKCKECAPCDVESRFSINSTVEETLQVYEKLVI